MIPNTRKVVFYEVVPNSYNNTPVMVPAAAAAVVVVVQFSAPTW
jgi:hypothetical protein